MNSHDCIAEYNDVAGVCASCYPSCYDPHHDLELHE